MNPKFKPTLLSKSKIIISLIHNNDTERLSYIKPNINDSIIELKKKIDVEFYEISWQPNLKPVCLWEGFLRDLIYWKLNREWMRYRQNLNGYFLFDFLLFVGRMNIKYIFNQDVSKRWLKSCAIEMLVSSKHIKAFAHALEKKADYLLVFEDDAIFKKDSISKLSSLLYNLEANNKIPTYIDLGGGCQFNELKIDKLELRRDDEFRYYIKPVTNTACCYLINQEQLKLFDYYLTRIPMLRYLGIDWLMNKLFILQSRDGVLSNCCHADPHFFNHGSVTGEFCPWVR